MFDTRLCRSRCLRKGLLTKQGTAFMVERTELQIKHFHQETGERAKGLKRGTYTTIDDGPLRIRQPFGERLNLFRGYTTVRRRIS